MIRFALLSVAVCLSACSVLPDPKPADVIYRISMSGESVAPQLDAKVIRVDRPSGSMVFNSSDIVASPDGRRMRQVARARWDQPIPMMLQESLVDALSQSDSLVGVLPSSATRTDTRVHFVIKNFEAQFDRGEDAAPLAVVRYTATVADASNRALIDTFSVKETVRADAARVSDIVEALEQANDTAMGQVVDWLESVAADGRLG